MSITAEISYLLDYTDWDRAQWEAWFLTEGPDALAISLGPNVVGSITNMGELVRHIFSAEQRYVERIQELPLSDTSSVSSTDVDALFAFGQRTREQMRMLLINFPAERWDVAREMQFGPIKRSIMPRTMAVQSVTHEIRHWAQIATLLRMDGRKTGIHDFLVSGVFERHASLPNDQHAAVR
jgi:uncharacterized damage-inducible protein DinB